MIRCQKCDQPAPLHITDLPEPRVEPIEFHLCEEHARIHLTDEKNQRPTVWGQAEKVDGAVRFDIERLIISEASEQQVVYVREMGGSRIFPIITGLFEATNLDRRLKGLTAPRPLTHDAWVGTVLALGGEIEYVCIGELQEHTYFANIRIKQADRYEDIDARPSDAFVIAIISGVPIYVSDDVLDEVCG